MSSIDGHPNNKDKSAQKISALRTDANANETSLKEEANNSAKLQSPFEICINHEQTNNKNQSSTSSSLPQVNHSDPTTPHMLPYQKPSPSTPTDVPLSPLPDCSPVLSSPSTITVLYQKKKHQIELDPNMTVFDLKQRIQALTKVPVDKQIILYNDMFLDDEKLLEGYDVQAGDQMAMGRIGDEGDYGISEKIHPVKIGFRNRRGSEGQSKKNTNAVNNAVSKFTCSVVQLPDSSKTPIISSQKLFSLNPVQNPQFGSFTDLFQPLSSQITQQYQQQEQEHLQLNIGLCVNTTSEEGGSPFIKNYLMEENKLVHEKQFSGGDVFGDNFFSNKNMFNVKVLQFCGQREPEDELLKLCSNGSWKIQDFHKEIQAVKQQVVFCQSYYEKQENPDSGLVQSLEYCGSQTVGNQKQNMNKKQQSSIDNHLDNHQQPTCPQKQ